MKKNFSVYHLVPMHSNVQSFYGKAMVFVADNGVKELMSYQTIVAIVNGNEMQVLYNDSATSCRHIHEFAKQEGFVIKGKPQLTTYKK